MSRLSNYNAIWISGLIILVYFGLYIETDYTTSKFIADWLALVGLAFMSASTTPVAYRAVLNGVRTDRDRFIFSYWFIWTLILFHRLWVILLSLIKIHLPDNYEDWYFSPISGLIAVGLGLAAGFGGIAPFSNDIPIPRRELIIFTIAAGFSGIIAGIAIGIFFVSGWTS